MEFDLPVTYAPMEAQAVDAIPSESGWQYEPKWDGFRALVFRNGDEIVIQSKSSKPLGRYFPEVVERLRSIPARHFVLDGELVIPIADALSFDDLLGRIHPAASRVAMLAHEHPATLLVFDLLVDGDGTVLVDRPLHERRDALERFFQTQAIDENLGIRLSPMTTDIAVVEDWYRRIGGALDGVVAKRIDLPYASGERTAVQKIKRSHTVDCVVGGFRYAADRRSVGSLLLGLYDEGRLDYVGFCSAFDRAERVRLLERLEALREAPGFDGNAPGGPSRWNRGKDRSWEPLRPELILEVAFDQATSGRFRHGTRPLRWRPDKAPKACTREQVERPDRSFRLLLSD